MQVVLDYPQLVERQMFQSLLRIPTGLIDKRSIRCNGITDSILSVRGSIAFVTAAVSAVVCRCCGHDILVDGPRRVGRSQHPRFR